MTQNILNLICLVILAACLSSCQTSSSTKVSKPKKVDCVFPNSHELAPGWVCGVRVEGLKISAVGSAERSAAGEEFMKSLALRSARLQLVQRKRAPVANMVKGYAETTALGDDKADTAGAEPITEETLNQTRIYKSCIGPDGTLYVLVGLGSHSAEKQAGDAARENMDNENRLWQKFRAIEVQDEMASDAAKMKAARSR